jgi:branched-chain amino acid aminotransferase
MSMADRDGVIWYDGKLVPWREATTHVLTHTLHYGMGVFEGVRAYKAEQGTAIFRLDEHTDRLFRSAHILGMKMPYDKATISAAQLTVVRENKLESGYLRPMAFFGSEAMGISAKNLSVHVIVAAWPWGAYLGQEALEHGIRVKTSSFSRHHSNVTMCKAKANGNYMNSILATRRPRWTATTRRYCWTSTASFPRARARTFSSSVTASSTRRIRVRPWSA